jgi:Ca-activated chloride channel family protein
LLQSSPDDVIVVIPFNHGVIDSWTVRGNDPAQLQALLEEIESLNPGGDTNIYDPTIEALETMEALGVDGYSPAVILMTDGQSNHGSFGDLDAYLSGATLSNVPVYSILFGDASTDQLTQIAETTSGRIFDGRVDLVEAFKTAKGYN